MKRLMVGGVMVLALTGCAADPQMPVAARLAVTEFGDCLGGAGYDVAPASVEQNVILLAGGPDLYRVGFFESGGPGIVHVAVNVKTKEVLSYQYTDRDALAEVGCLL